MIPSTLWTLIGDFLTAWGPRVICFILCSFSVSVLTSDHISFTQHIHFLTLVLQWRLRDISLSPSLQSKEVEHLHASDFFVFIGKRQCSEKLKCPVDPDIFFFWISLQLLLYPQRYSRSWNYFSSHDPSLIILLIIPLVKQTTWCKKRLRNSLLGPVEPTVQTVPASLPFNSGVS